MTPHANDTNDFSLSWLSATEVLLNHTVLSMILPQVFFSRKTCPASDLQDLSVVFIDENGHRM